MDRLLGYAGRYLGQIPMTTFRVVPLPVEKKQSAQEKLEDRFLELLEKPKLKAAEQDELTALFRECSKDLKRLKKILKRSPHEGGCCVDGLPCHCTVVEDGEFTPLNLSYIDGDEAIEAQILNASGAGTRTPRRRIGFRLPQD